VAAMSQGRYVVTTDDKGVQRLFPSPEAGMLIARPGPSLSARERLGGSTVDEAATLVTQIRKARDEKK
jgi:hypothetical protein